ncbi:hypothetical protein [Providencia rettgeri]|uniref:hypothetical protein n=1 Tax=Providencia rettgeri TaxID=587 RepID=UPI002551E09E|nr:hypothetical protein [Providencia rettgeri]MDK7744710.1 hypothetical protein [Providencia rettgeri]MDK7759372.1 hypothetical protein [Providencia rettgeri]
MKWMIAGATALLLVGCDSTSTAPFGLNWGQSIDSISFIKAGKCQASGSKTVCTFGQQKPFNDWSYENQLTFDDGTLIQVATTLVGVEDYASPKPDFADFQQKLENEMGYLTKQGFNSQVASDILTKCQSEANCNKVSESSPTRIGTPNLWVTINPTPIAIITYSQD